MRDDSPSKSIVSIGEALWDLFPDGARFGGAPANFACHAALLGSHVTMLSAVGKDAFGDEALGILRGMGVDISLVQRHESVSTGTVGVDVDKSGKPSFVIHADAAWDRLRWTPEFEAVVAEADAIYFGTLGQRSPESRKAITQTLQIAERNGVRRVLDVNLRAPFFDNALIRESVAMATIVKLSDDEFQKVSQACELGEHSDPMETLVALRQKFDLELVAMTRGAEGAVVVTRSETIDQPGIPVNVCDTVGAGDAFTAAMVVGLCSGASVRSFVANACRVASVVCGYAGAIPGPSIPPL